MENNRKEIKSLFAQGKIAVKKRPEQTVRAAAPTAGSPFDGKRKDYSQYKKVHDVTDNITIIPPTPRNSSAGRSFWSKR